MVVFLHSLRLHFPSGEYPDLKQRLRLRLQQQVSRELQVQQILYKFIGPWSSLTKGLSYIDPETGEVKVDLQKAKTHPFIIQALQLVANLHYRLAFPR